MNQIPHAKDPWFYKDATGHVLLFFSMRLAGGGAWKLHYRDAEGQIHRVYTGETSEISETAPAVRHDPDSGLWHMSYIAENPATGDRALTCISPEHVDGVTDKFIPVHRHEAAGLMAGFSLPDMGEVVPEGDGVRIQLQDWRDRLELPRCEIHHIGYDATARGLYISGVDQNEDRLFCLFTTPTGYVAEVVANGSAAYRCASHENVMVFCSRNHHLQTADSVEMAATALLARKAPRQTKSPCGSCGGCGDKVAGHQEHAADQPTQASLPPTRESCIECVEKHMGAAYVLMSEMRDGYANRLRIVGHFHEAEDESQAFPELHAFIRVARKAYQGQGIVPDWEGIGALISREVARA